MSVVYPTVLSVTGGTVFSTLLDGGGFSPASLFANGEAGDAYIPQRDFTYTKSSGGLYERVTTTGDAVARITGVVNGTNADQDTIAARPAWGEGSGLSWFESDGVNDFLQGPEGVAVTDNWFVSFGFNRFAGGSNAGGPWRWLSDGESATSQTANLLEEYYGSFGDNTRRSIFSRKNAGGSSISITGVIPNNDTPYVAWANRSTSEIRYGQYFTGSSKTNESVSGLPYATTGTGSISLSRGYGGDFIKGRTYGIIFVWGDVSAENRQLANEYIGARTGVTI